MVSKVSKIVHTPPMLVTLKHIFKKAFTVQYPEERLEIPERFRGLHAYNLDKCIACRMCEKACPNKCIQLEISTYEVEVETPDGEKKTKTKKKVDGFNIYLGRCMFCGLCVDNCPKGALGMTTEYEFSDNDRKSLVYGIDRLPKKEMPKEEEKENEPES